MKKKEVRKTLKVLAKLKKIHSGFQHSDSVSIVEHVNKKIEEYTKLL